MGRILEIDTERLILKPLGMEYLQTTFEYASDIENTRYMVHLPDETIEEAKEFLTRVEEEWQKEEPDYYEFAVILDGAHIGAVCVYLDENRTSGELGWILNKKYWGNGYAYEAADAVIDFVAGNLGIMHFVAHCDSENVASYKIMEKLGMQRTDSYHGRKNRSSDEDREEYQYEIDL